MLRIQSFRPIIRNTGIYSPALPKLLVLTPARNYSIKGKVTEKLHDLNESTKGASKIIEKTEDMAHKVQDKAGDLKDSLKSEHKEVKSKAKETGHELKAKGEQVKREGAKKVDDIKKNI